MDTDDLTNMAYENIRIAAYFNDYLKAELGAMSGQFKEEEEYLGAMLAHVIEIRKHPRSYLESWNIENETNIKTFRQNIVQLENHIDKTIQTPKAKRSRIKEK